LTLQIAVPIIDDDACFFHSISFNLFITRERCQKIRYTVVSYASYNWNNFITRSYILNGDNFFTSEDYVRGMVNPTVYGVVITNWLQLEIFSHFYLKFIIIIIFMLLWCRYIPRKKKFRITGYMSRYFDVYLSITTLEVICLFLIMLASATENLIDKRKKHRRARYADRKLKVNKENSIQRKLIPKAIMKQLKKYQENHPELNSITSMIYQACHPEVHSAAR